jgi:F420H(2)-dependent quinone reductase
MPLTGEYEPSPVDWAREQADKYIESGGTDGTVLLGKPVILLTTVGAKTGKLRKTPLMRVEHNGEYAIVASLGGAPKNPVWYYNVVARSPGITTHTRCSVTRRPPGGSALCRCGRTTPVIRKRPTARFRCSS